MRIGFSAMSRRLNRSGDCGKILGKYTDFASNERMENRMDFMSTVKGSMLEGFYPAGIFLPVCDSVLQSSWRTHRSAGSPQLCHEKEYPRLFREDRSAEEGGRRACTRVRHRLHVPYRIQGTAHVTLDDAPLRAFTLDCIQPDSVHSRTSLLPQGTCGTIGCRGELIDCGNRNCSRLLSMETAAVSVRMYCGLNRKALFCDAS